MNDAKDIERKPRYDYVAARKLYEERRDALNIKDKSWRYRFALPAGLAILGGCFGYGFALTTPSMVAPLHPSIAGLLWLVSVLFVSMLGAHWAYQRRCVAALLRAGIDVPQRDPEPDLRELWRDRHELRRHRLKNHLAWQLARYLGAGIVGAALIILLYALPGSTFPEKTPAHQVVHLVIVCVVSGGYMIFAVESSYLSRIWKRIHLAGNDDQS